MTFRLEHYSYSLPKGKLENLFYLHANTPIDYQILSQSLLLDKNCFQLLEFLNKVFLMILTTFTMITSQFEKYHNRKKNDIFRWRKTHSGKL